MDISHLIARRLLHTQEQTFTRVIVKIAIAAIAVSMTVMLLTSTMIAGFKQEITKKIIGFWGHIHITDGGLSNTLEQMATITIDSSYLRTLMDTESISYQEPADILGVPITDRYRTAVTHGGIDHIQAFAFLPGILSTKELFGGVILKGVGPDYDWDRLAPYLLEGSPIDLSDAEDNELIISSTISRKLKISLGQRVRLSFIRGRQQIKRAFVVTGIYNTGLEEFDRQFAIVDISKVRDILNMGPDDIHGYEVFLDDTKDIDMYAEYIYYEILPPNLLAQGITTRLSSIFDWLKLQDINLHVILLLMILVAVINMTTALLILILDRTPMIGILKAIGCTDWHVRKIFVYQAAYIIGIGMLIGNVIGLGLSAVQKYTGFIKLDEANYYLTEAPISFDWWTIIGINLGTFVVTVLFLILPTFIITRVSPVKVLTFS